MRLLRWVVVVERGEGAAFAGGGEHVQVVLPAWACVGGEVAVAEVVDEAKLGRVARLRQRQLEAPLAEVVLRGEGEVPGWVATLDRHVGPGLALLVEHLEPHGLAGAGVSFPAPDPAGGALGVGDARPDI